MCINICIKIYGIYKMKNIMISYFNTSLIICMQIQNKTFFMIIERRL